MKNAYNTSAYGSFAYVYDIFMEMIDQITVYENRKLKISYNFGNELEHLFSSVYCEDLEKKAI